METVYIGIGSNVGRRVHYLAQAVHGLQSISVDGKIRCSPIYETEPVELLEQPLFLNMVAVIDVELRPFDVLNSLHKIERSAGRRRTIRYGPRTLDLDILFYGCVTINDPQLQIPHPRLSERAFVLRPLADLSPGLRLEGGTQVSELASRAQERGGVRCVGHFW